MATSERFRNQLVDAVTSLRVGYPQDPVSQMGPLIEPASGKLLHALTTLGAEEEWLVEPRRLDDSGRLWSPGVRAGVKPGSYFHLTEFFGPVLGVMTARNLEEAIRYQNAVEYGLTAGLHSLDSDELAQWLDERHVEGHPWVRLGERWVDAEGARYSSGATTPMDHGFVASASGDVDWTELRKRIRAKGGSP